MTDTPSNKFRTGYPELCPAAKRDRTQNGCLPVHDSAQAAGRYFKGVTGGTFAVTDIPLAADRNPSWMRVLSSALRRCFPKSLRPCGPKSETGDARIIPILRSLEAPTLRSGKGAGLCRPRRQHQSGNGAVSSSRAERAAMECFVRQGYVCSHLRAGS